MQTARYPEIATEFMAESAIWKRRAALKPLMDRVKFVKTDEHGDGFMEYEVTDRETGYVFGRVYRWEGDSDWSYSAAFRHARTWSQATRNDAAFQCIFDSALATGGTFTVEGRRVKAQREQDEQTRNRASKQAGASFESMYSNLKDLAGVDREGALEKVRAMQQQMADLEAAIEASA